jgi:RpiB/LacA/LacB family sugar-phosphate isomerase
MITQLGNHRGKQIVFGHDRYLEPELGAYLEMFARHGLPIRVVDPLAPHYLTSAARACRRIQRRPDRVGVLVCLTGIGMSIAANKFRGIYAARCLDVADAASARTVNNANVLCLAVSSGLPVNAAILDTFLGTPYEGRKLEQLAHLGELEAELDPAPARPRGKSQPARIA